MEYYVTGVELNYGRVKLPVTSANFIQLFKLPENPKRVADFVQICANAGRMAPWLSDATYIT